jgi:hypothetical protein
MRSGKLNGLRELLNQVQVLSGRKWVQPALERTVQVVLGPLAREVSIRVLTQDGVLVIACCSASARERVQALEPILLTELSSIESVEIRRIDYTIDARAGRDHVPERLTRQLRPVSEADKKEISAIASGMKDPKLRATFEKWMTTVAQLEQSKGTIINKVEGDSPGIGDAGIDEQGG